MRYFRYRRITFSPRGAPFYAGIFAAVVAIVLGGMWFFGKVIAAQATIDSSVSTNTTWKDNNSPDTVFVSDQVGYIFYRDGDGKCVYSKTVNGGDTWGASILVGDNSTCTGIAVWYDRWTPGDSTGNLIHIVAVLTVTNDMYYNTLDVTTDSLALAATGPINLSSDKTNTFTEMSPSITRATNGVLFAGVKDGGTTGDQSYVKKCSASCTAATTNWADTSIAVGNDFQDEMLLMPLASGNILYVEHDASADVMQSKVYSNAGSAWDASFVVIDTAVPENTGTGYGGYISATLNKLTNDVYISYWDNAATISTTTEMDVAVYSNGAWTLGPIIVTGATVNGKLAFDENTDELYFIYTLRSTAGTATTASVYYKKSTDGGTTWSAQSAALNTAANDLQGARVNIMSNERIYVSWHDPDGANADKLYGNTVVDLTKPFALTQSDYRWYANADSVQPGEALQSSNTSHVMVCNAVHSLRLRLGITSAYRLPAGSNQFKLQYAQNTSGPWTDVGGLANTWYDAAWSARRKITFDNALSSQNLVNFPVRVSLNATNIDYSKTQNSGQDLRFTDSDGTTLLSYEIETWNEAGTSEVWVKVPQIDANSAGDSIYMYYGNTGATDGQNAASTWDSNYQVVMHMKEDPSGTAPQMQDSTANNRDGTTSGMTAGSQVAGRINGSLDFAATNSYVMPAYNTAPTTLTYETWLSADSSGGGGLGRVMDKGNSAAGTSIYTDAAGKIYFGSGFSSVNGRWNTTNGVIPLDGSLHHVAITYDASSPSNVPSIYVNGVSQTLTATTTASGTPVTNTDNYYIGNNAALARNWDGIIDEFRISSSIRSAEWVEAQHLSTANNMNTFGGEEAYTGTGSIIWDYYNNPVTADGSTITSLLLAGSTALQSYVETNPTVLNPNAIAAAGKGEWDFSLKLNILSYSTYMFRLVVSDGAVLSTYSEYPTVTIVEAPPMESVMRHGTFFFNEAKKPFACTFSANTM